MKYRTIVADPPWDHSDGTGAKLKIGFGRTQRELIGGPVTTGMPYSALSLAEIQALPVADLAKPDAHLYVWTTNRYLRHVWDIAEGWGFSGVCVLTWCKEMRGFLGGGAYPSNTEFCLFARRGHLPTLSRATEGRWYRWPRRFGPPVREGQKRATMHSAKPEAFLDLVEQVSPRSLPRALRQASTPRLGHLGQRSAGARGADRMTPTLFQYLGLIAIGLFAGLVSASARGRR